jgi:hypothetical protein
VFVALGIQYAMRMHHIVTCGLAGSENFFSILNNKRQDFWKTFPGHKMCRLIFSKTISKTFQILRRTERDMKKRIPGSIQNIPN